MGNFWCSHQAKQEQVKNNYFVEFENWQEMKRKSWCFIVDIPMLRPFWDFLTVGVVFVSVSVSVLVFVFCLNSVETFMPTKMCHILLVFSQTHFQVIWNTSCWLENYLKRHLTQTEMNSLGLPWKWKAQHNVYLWNQ